MGATIKIPKDWYRRPEMFFNEGYLKEAQDPLFFPAGNTKKQVDFFEKICGLKPGMEILDLACGYGRHSLELARRGYKVTGQDINERFLTKAEADAKKENLKIEFIKSDMREIPFSGEFDAVCMFYTSFGYLETDEENQKVMDGIVRALKPSGRVFLDILSQDMAQNFWRGAPSVPILNGQGTVILDNRFDFESKRAHIVETRIWEGGFKEYAFLSIRAYIAEEIAAMLKNSGTVFVGVCGDYNGSNYNEWSRNCLVIGKKLNSKT